MILNKAGFDTSDWFGAWMRLGAYAGNLYAAKRGESCRRRINTIHKIMAHAEACIESNTKNGSHGPNTSDG